MTKPIKHMYRIQYEDNTFQIVDWTKAEFKSVGEAKMKEEYAILLEDALFRLRDIRAIVFIPPVPEPTVEDKKLEAERQLSEWGFVDQETAEWLKNNGFDLGKGVN